jgi:hypothetical protein
MTAELERFQEVVDERGWLSAIWQFVRDGEFAFLGRVLKAGLEARRARILSDLDVKSSDELTREVIAEVKADAPQDGTRIAQPDFHHFLQLLERREREERESIAARLVTTKDREATLYRAQLIAALLTVVVGFLAVGLVFAGAVPVGVATGAVGIIPGSGTVLLRRMWQRERSARDFLEERRNEHAGIVDAIEGTLSVPDPSERDRLAAQLAERLQERAFAGRTS